MGVLELRRARNSVRMAARTEGLVAHVVPEYLPRSATFIHTLLRHQRRFRPLVLAKTTSNLDEFPIERALALNEPEPRPRRALKRLRSLVSGYGSTWEWRIGVEARRNACVLLHAHFGWAGADSVAAARRLGIPLLTTFYGRDLSEAERARFRDPYRALFAKGSRFVVEGPHMADHLAHVGAPAERIRIVPVGIELERFPFADRPLAEPLVVVQPGRFVEKKGFDLSVRAFAAARSLLPRSELWLIGDGPLRLEIEQLVRRYSLDDVVKFWGMVSYAQYAQLTAGAHICLQPSRVSADGDTEGGAPTVILEMQALGIPVVATRHADIPFVVARPEELAPEEDVDALAAALLRVAHEQDAERRSRAEEARAFVERRHDARATAASVESVYEETLA